MKLSALFAVVIFCLVAAGVLAATPLWLYVGLAGLAFAVLSPR